MGSARKPRGRLPQRVYWVRRSLVLVVALLLVFGIGKLLGGTGEDDPGPAATTGNVAAPQQQQPSGSVTLAPAVPSTKVRTKNAAPLPSPDGECVDEDVRVQPTVPKAQVGSPVIVQLQLQGTELACTFDVSPETMVVKIASGKDRIWSSQDCPKSIPTTQVVVRSSQPVAVPVTWSGRRSDDGCTNASDWALPGFYHVYAAALGSAPTDVQFQITRAAPRIVTKTPKPKPSASASARPSVTPSPTAKPSKATGGVKGKQSKCGGDNAASSC